MITLTGTDILNAATSGAQYAAIAIPAFLVSTAVNKLAHKIFSVEDDWDLAPSLVIKACAIVTGMRVTMAIAPEVALNSLLKFNISLFIICNICNL
ncbi:MAG: hypothetical protein K940chlam3_00302 [Chlamydiae bacterium]|nr:hypothetical protein [Chlamydiota bacterium]